MDDILWIIAATLIFIICILLIGLFGRRSGGWSTESSQRRAGRAGERQATAEIRQVKRQVYLLAHHLRSHGIHVWVEGYVLLLQGNSPVDAPCVLSTLGDIDRALHTNSRTEVSRETVDAVCRLLT